MNIEANLRYFYLNFPDVFPKIYSSLPKYVKTANNSVVDLIFKDQKVLLTILIYFVN